MVLVLMGVSGCGKTTVGKQLSEKLNLPFYDADDFHPPENVEKMSNGVPLTDHDRSPWLEILHGKIAEWSRGDGAVLACSALKQAYRKKLRGDLGDDQVRFIYLKGSAELIRNRLKKRESHYMPAGLLDSQFTDLEEPQHAITVTIDRTVNEITNRILEKMDQLNGS